MTKVLVLGLDGGTWKVLAPLAEAGLLPSLQRVLEKGSSGKLISTIPPNTSPAWPSMCTGLNPGKLGVYSVLMPRDSDAFSLKPVTSSVYKGKAVWDYLSEEGFCVALFKVPFLYPVYRIRGCMVSGFGSASKLAAYPRDLYKKLMAAPSRILEISLFNQLDNIGRARELNDTQSCVKFIEQLKKLVQEESKVVLRISHTFRWDFLFYVVSAMDWVQHAFMDKILELTRKIESNDLASLNMMDKALIDFYQCIDLLVGSFLTLLEEMRDDYTLLLVSDHGFTIRPYTFNLARWLNKEGYMRLKTGYVKRSGVIVALHARILNLIERITSTMAMERLFRILPSGILSKLASVYYRIYKRAVSSISKQIDFETSKAFCLEDCAIHVNPSASDGAFLDQLINDLGEYLKQLGGVELRALRSKEIYWGEKVKMSPDLTLEILDGNNIWEISSDLSRPLIFRQSLPGKHDHLGIFSAYGPWIKEGTWLENLMIWDVACTVLHMFDAAIPISMDGRVLKEIFKGGSDLAERPVLYQGIERQRIKGTIERLRASRKRGLE